MISVVLRKRSERNLKRLAENRRDEGPIVGLIHMIRSRVNGAMISICVG